MSDADSHSTSASPLDSVSGGYVPALDGVRGIAVVMVLLHHFVPRSEIETLGDFGLFVKQLTNSGGMGVDIFFVLSGFLITGILLRAKGQPNYFRNFYARRSLRIFPLYYLALTLTFVVMPRIFGHSDGSYASQHQAWMWLYGTNFLSAYSGEFLVANGFALNHFWSLAVEEQFYLVWPAVIYLCRTRRHVVVVALAMYATAFVARGIEIPRLGLRPVHMLTWCNLDSLAIGALLAALSEMPTAFRRVQHGLIVIGVLAGVISLTFGNFGRSWGIAENETAGFWLIPMGRLAGGGLVAYALTQRSHRCLSHPILIWLGQRSYGIYVYHGMLRLYYSTLSATLVSHLPPALAVPLSLAIGILVTFLIAEISYRYFESPINSLKKHFRTSPSSHGQRVESEPA